MLLHWGKQVNEVDEINLLGQLKNRRQRNNVIWRVYLKILFDFKEVLKDITQGKDTKIQIDDSSSNAVHQLHGLADPHILRKL